MIQKTGIGLLLAGLMAMASATQAQEEGPVRARGMATAGAASNLPSRAGEASTMTGGVPNLVTSNAQPGEMGIQERLTIRRSPIIYGGDPGLRLMGASGPMRPMMIAPPEPAR